MCQWYREISTVRCLHTSPFQTVVYGRIVRRKNPKKILAMSIITL
jgi:hypothetical protein